MNKNKIDISENYEAQLQEIRAVRYLAKAYVLDLLENVDEYSRIAHVQESRLGDGWTKFGDKMWKLGDEKIKKEVQKRLADALNFACAFYASYPRDGS